MPNALVLDAPPSRGVGPGPAQPCLFYPSPWQKPVVFPSPAALAAGVQRRRAGRTLRLEPTTATLFGSDSFPAFKVFFAADGCDEAFAFTLAGIGACRDRLVALIAANNPDIPQ